MTDYTILEFTSEEAAEAALHASGFSLGHRQRDERRGVMFGDYAISKWRNMSQREIDELHGVYERAFRGGPVKITLRETCPADAVEALRKTATS